MRGRLPWGLCWLSATVMVIVLISDIKVNILSLSLTHTYYYHCVGAASNQNDMTACYMDE